MTLRSFGIIASFVLIAACSSDDTTAGGAAPAPGGSSSSSGGGGGANDAGGTAEGGTSGLLPDGGVAAYELPTTVTPIARGSVLDWTFDDTRSSFASAVANVAKQCEARRTTFVAQQAFVPVIKDEGLLPGDPLIAQMKPAKASLDQVGDVAFCAYFGKSLEERRASRDAVAAFIAKWGETYVGDGNPINDRFFVSLMIAADLVMPKLTAEEIAPLTKMLSTMDAKGAAFMGGLGPSDGRLKNNWMLRHLTIRSYANLLLGDQAALSSVKSALDTAIQTQYTAPAGFKLSTCANLKAIGVYGSYDLQQRDAFVYHAAGLAEVVPFLRLRPGHLSDASKTKLETALGVTKPYVEGTKSHPEFKCTSVQYDKDKVAADPSLADPWDPNDARVLFRHARLAMPSVVDWTTKLVTDQFHPWEKVYFAGKGD